VNIYVGNLSHETGEEDLRELFKSYGEVSNVSIIRDKYSGESRGFGFVEMSKKEEAQKAIAGISGTEVHGRTLNVNEARPRTERSGGGYRDNRGGGRRSW
jgi:RNA recognition motif-containing protein